MKRRSGGPPRQRINTPPDGDRSSATIPGAICRDGGKELHGCIERDDGGVPR
jgi:hypothetical protein